MCVRKDLSYQLKEVLSSYIDEEIGMQQIGERISDLLIDIALESCKPSVGKAAEMLNMSLRTEQKRLKRRRDLVAVK